MLFIYMQIESATDSIAKSTKLFSTNQTFSGSLPRIEEYAEREHFPLRIIPRSKIGRTGSVT